MTKHKKIRIILRELSLFWWTGVDSNHRSRWRQIYSLFPLAAREPVRILELAIGIEPTTCWLQVSCSANWATPAILLKKWCLRAESNHRQRDFQSLALPTELPRHIFLPLNFFKGKIWRPGWGSNPRPLAWQASVLTSWTTRPFENLLCVVCSWWAF